MKPLTFKDEEIRFLAWCIEGSSGADAKSLVQWLKKSSVLENGQQPDLVKLLKRFVLLNSGRIDPSKRNLLALADLELMKALLQDTRYGFNQKEAASFMNIAQSTLCKKLGKLKDTEGESQHVQ